MGDSIQAANTLFKKKKKTTVNNLLKSGKAQALNGLVSFHIVMQNEARLYHRLHEKDGRRVNSSSHCAKVRSKYRDVAAAFLHFIWN